MERIVVEAEPRHSFGKGANRRLRGMGKIPAIVYGQGKDPVSVSVDPADIIRILRSHAGSNTIFGLLIQGESGADSVMVKDYQLEPLEHELLHADLIRVAMDQVMTITVHVELQGTPVGVKNEGGLLDFVSRSIEVSCLPADIPESITVDVSGLALGQLIRADGLRLPAGVTLKSDPEIVIAHVIAPRKVEVEEEAAPAEAAEEAAEPEVIRKGKAEEEPTE